ncbi:hypothetical protein FRUB_08841 [Fimbriiglobus ruber]|uniref:DUF3352 domain-containing protein n=1 Tax=Fimbriiglobus ruber TaxID=1908690 RepID=A0A225DCL2_9BACT|nr:hypothetical protein [Fimbriiglobus ruber]OWK36278.1 hypothetical protein FRUB_08841 [Fimbriiglobus ruber]
MFRRLWVGAALVVLAAAPARTAEIDNVLPAETDYVMFVNVRQALDSDITKKFALGQLKQALEGNDAQKMIKKLGLDPLKDIDRVTIGGWGKDTKDQSFVLVVRGKFDAEKLFTAAQEEAKNNGDKLAIVEEGKYKLVKVTIDNQPKPIFVAVADEKTVVGGSDPKVAVAAIQAVEKKANPVLKKELAALVLKQDEKATMFACGLTEGKIDKLPPNVNIPNVDTAKLSKQLEKLQSIAITLRMTEDVALEVNAGMKDGDAAEDFGDSVDKLINTAKTFIPFIAGQQPKMKLLADELGQTLKSKVKEKDVLITLKLSAEAINKATTGE